MERLRLGVIGIGNMGSEHCKSILSGKTPLIELACVADVRADRRAWAAEALPAGTQIFDSGEALIAARACDAVLIAAPHPLHPPLTVAALDAGLHVLCEKPIAVTVSEARPMLDAAERTGKTFALMFNQRTNCLYRRLKALLDSGEMGQLKRVTWTITDWYRTQRYYDSGQWRATWLGEGGGVLLNQSPHQLDLLQWLCGMPSLVRAFCHEGKWHDIEVEDDVTAYLEFPNGATGVFVTSTGDLPGTNRLELLCERGKLVCENGCLRLWKLPFNEREFCPTADVPYVGQAFEPVTLDTDGENPQHVGVLNAFAAHVLHGAPLVAEGAEGIRSLALSDAMRLSSWLGEPVTLPIDEARYTRLLDAHRRTSRFRSVADVTFDTNHTSTGGLAQDGASSGDATLGGATGR